MPPLGYRHFDQVLDAARRKYIELDALQAYLARVLIGRVMGKPEVILNWCYQAHALIDEPFVRVPGGLSANKK